MDIKATSESRLPESLSYGENIKKLLELHTSMYSEEIVFSDELKKIYDIQLSAGAFLDWFGITQGLVRPKTTSLVEPFTKVAFTDEAFKIIIKAYCEIFDTGTIDEYSQFIKNIFGVDVTISLANYDLVFIFENSLELSVDFTLIDELTPKLSQTKNTFFQSPYSLFSLEFDNLQGTPLEFDTTISHSFYFSF